MEPAKEFVKPRVILVKQKQDEGLTSMRSSSHSDRALIKSKVTGYGGSDGKPQIEINDNMNQLSDESDEEEQTPMINEAEGKEDFTSMLPGEELLERKEVEAEEAQEDKNHLAVPQESLDV